MRRLAALLLALPLAGLAAGAADYVRLPGGSFRSALKIDGDATVRIAPFALMKRPVTNAEFLAFVRTHPSWRRDRVDRALAGTRYLSQWRGAVQLVDDAQAQRPVTQVSWFAARAYCEAQDARLPTFLEWEYAASADETRTDARSDPAWRDRVLAAFSREADPLPRAGLQPPNAYGVQDLHGLVSEWNGDVASPQLAPPTSGDARTCGGSATGMDDPANYPVVMRVSLLSSLALSDTTSHLGFRCARSMR